MGTHARQSENGQVVARLPGERYRNTFVVNAIVVYVWNLISHGAGVFNWPATLTIATTISIVLTLFEARTSGD